MISTLFDEWPLPRSSTRFAASKARPARGSSLERAIRYMQNHWRGLTKFVDHPEIWLENNATERALRAPILGRKNHYGSKSKRGMKAAAVLYSLVETCQLIGVNPRVYLREALYRVKANPGTAFLPHEMLEAASHLNQATKGDRVGT